MFNQGRTSVCNDDLSGRPLLVTDDLKAKVQDKNSGEPAFHFKHITRISPTNFPIALT